MTSTELQSPTPQSVLETLTLREADVTIRTYADLYPHDHEVPDRAWIPK